MEDLESRCRLCEKVTQSELDLFDSEIDQIVYESFGIEIPRKDGWPSRVCKMCVISVTGVREFREKIQKTQINYSAVIPDILEELQEEIEEPVIEQEPEPEPETDVGPDSSPMDHMEPEEIIEEAEISKEEQIEERTHHLAISRKQPLPPGPPFTCFECGSIYATLASLQHHAKTHSLKEKHLVCPYCFVDLFSMTQFKEHVEQHINRCKWCNWSFSNSKDLSDHMITHEIRNQQKNPSSKTFFCRVCKLTFANRNLFNFHNKTHHDTTIPIPSQRRGSLKAPPQPAIEYEEILVEINPDLETVEVIEEVAS